MRNGFLEEKNDAYMMERNQYVANQDKVVIEDLRPVLTPETSTKEFMLPADKCILMYRDKLKEWDAKGWRIDMDTVEKNSAKVAYAIPSPARHEQKGWVLDAIPLVSGESAKAKLKAAS
jgi:hypothetical protein